MMLLLAASTFAGVLLLAAASEPVASDDAGKIERGRYLVTLGGCGDCHTPKKMTQAGPVEDSTRLLSGHPASEMVGEVPANLGAGGWIATCNAHLTAWAGPWGVSYAVNLTSDPKTGLGGWNDEQFIKAMRTGKHRGFGRPILPPMPWVNLSYASDADLSAILAFLKSTQPIVNKVPEPVMAAAK